MSIGGIGSTRDFVLRCLFLLQWKHTSSIVDLTDDDGPPKWGLAKITAVKPQNPKEEFHLHWFGTYSKAKSLAKRAYAPAYIDTKDDLEIYKWKKTKTLEEMTIV